MADDAEPIDTLAPGLYLDTDGDYWAKRPDGAWYFLSANPKPIAAAQSPLVGYGPLTPVPWPESEQAAEPADADPADAFAEAVQSAGFLAADAARIGGARISVTISEAGSTGRTASVEVAP